MKLETHDKATALIRDINWLKHLQLLYRGQIEVGVKNIENAIQFINNGSQEEKYFINITRIENTFKAEMADKLVEIQKEIDYLQKHFDEL